jgi:sulfite exporter TauE/SafE
MPQSALIGAFLAGLLGGLHCVAMCGGWVAVVTRSASVPLVPVARLRVDFLASQAGRLTTYVLLGVLFGAAGGAALAAALGPVQRGLYIGANLLLLLLAVSIAMRGASFAPLERAGLAAFRRVAPAVARAGLRHGVAGRYLLGLLWGITPCALVYGVLPVAMLAGGALDGGLVMLAFGLGTLPNLLAAGWTLSRTQRSLARPWFRYVAATVVAGFALAGLYRALTLSDAMAHGPFCLFP